MLVIMEVFSEYNEDSILLSRKVCIKDTERTVENNAYVQVNGSVVQIRTQDTDRLIRQYVNVPVLVRYYVDTATP